jgi:hypothetical protein
MAAHNRGAYVPHCRAIPAHTLGDIRMTLRMSTKPGAKSPKQTLADEDAKAGGPAQLTANSRPGGATQSPQPDDPACEIRTGHCATAAVESAHDVAFADEAGSSYTLWLTRDKAASYRSSAGYPITTNRLAKLAVTGGGPEYRRWGSRMLYDPTLLMKCAKDRESTPGRPAHHPMT